MKLQSWLKYKEDSDMTLFVNANGINLMSRFFLLTSTDVAGELLLIVSWTTRHIWFCCCQWWPWQCIWISEELSQGGL